MEGENLKEIHDLKGEDEEQGVLLYYKYVTIPNPTTVVDWFRANCTSLGLLGRVRVAPEGINVTWRELLEVEEGMDGIMERTSSGTSRIVFGSFLNEHDDFINGKYYMLL